MASACKMYVAPNNPPSAQTAYKGGKGKGRIKWMRMPDRQHAKGKWVTLYPAPEEVSHDLLMLQHLKVRITKENWSTLRFFNTKTSNPEYFPSYHLPPVPTVVSETGEASTATFPHSTITGTVEDFRALLLICSRSLQEHQDFPRCLPGGELGWLFWSRACIGQGYSTEAHLGVSKAVC
jgi:hypothetical protein